MPASMRPQSSGDAVESAALMDAERLPAQLDFGMEACRKHGL